MRFRVEPRDVPAEAAARRLGMTLAAFVDALPNLVARGFPAEDPDTHNFDLDAIDAWRRLRHAHLFSAPVAMGARDASAVVGDRLAAMKRAGGRG